MYENKTQGKDIYPLVEIIPIFYIYIYCRFIIQIKSRFITLIYCITGIN